MFSTLGEWTRTRRIMRWAVYNLSDGEGQFYHERRRWFTKWIALMRWCQAWMVYTFAVAFRQSNSEDP